MMTLSRAACCPSRYGLTPKASLFQEPLYPEGAELLHVHRGEVVLRLRGADPGLKLGPPASLDNGFYHENAAFFDTIRAGQRPVGDVASGLQAVEIADAVRQRLPSWDAATVPATAAL